MKFINVVAGFIFVCIGSAIILIDCFSVIERHLHMVGTGIYFLIAALLFFVNYFKAIR